MGSLSEIMVLKSKWGQPSIAWNSWFHLQRMRAPISWLSLCLHKNNVTVSTGLRHFETKFVNGLDFSLPGTPQPVCLLSSSTLAWPARTSASLTTTYLPFKIACPYSSRGNFCYFLLPTLKILDAKSFRILGGLKNNAFLLNKSIPKKKYGVFLQQFKVLKRLLIIFSKLKQTVLCI